MIKDDNDVQMISGDLVCLKLPDICLTGEEKPRKNLTQETCPDRESNPSPLRDRRACQTHSGGLKVRSSTANSETQAAVLLGMNRWGSFPLLPASHSLFSIWTDLKNLRRSQGHQHGGQESGFWLTGPSGLRRNSQQGLNISSIRVSDQIRDLEIPTALRPRVYKDDTDLITDTVS